MRIHFRIPSLLAFALVALLASCSKSNQQGKLVPKDAAFVLHINGSSLNSKLPWDEVKKNMLFEKINTDTTIPAFIKSALNQPDNSGIDIASDLMVFAQRDSIGGYIAFEGSLKSVDKFRSFNLDAISGGLESERGDIKMISRSPVCVGWNKEKFVYIYDAPQMNRKNNFDFDSTIVKKNRDIGAACKAIFDLKSNNSLAEDEKFTTLMNKKGDVHFWLNTEQLYKDAAGFDQLKMLKLDKFYEGNFMTGTLNFENGKINLDYQTYVGKELKDLFKKYSGGSIDENMLKSIPSKDVAVAMAIHFKPEMIKELITLSGMEGLVNIGLMTVGFSVDDFIKANKGDVLFALSNLRSEKDSVQFKDMNGDYKVFDNSNVKSDYIFSAAIGDKDAFNLLIKAGKKLSDKGMDDSSSSIAYNTNAKYFAIGNSKQNVEKYLAGNSNNNMDFISHITGNPIGGYINLQYIMRAMQSEMTKDSSAKVIYDASLKIWDNIYIRGGQFEDGAFNYSFEVNLVDRNVNSLKQLNQYLGEVGRVMEEKNKRSEANLLNSENNFNDVVVPAPPAPSSVKRK
jgi:hypothetical protein